MPEEKLVPIIKLPKDMATDLVGLETELKRARKGIAALKEMGMETDALEEKLVWAEHVRETLLKEFS